MGWKPFPCFYAVVKVCENLEIACRKHSHFVLVLLDNALRYWTPLKIDYIRYMAKKFLQKYLINSSSCRNRIILSIIWQFYNFLYNWQTWCWMYMSVTNLMLNVHVLLDVHDQPIVRPNWCNILGTRQLLRLL